jgi:hypothetical protein
MDIVEDGPGVSELMDESMGMSCISRCFIISMLDISDICGISETVADVQGAVVMFSGSIHRA